jgi:hypothetical protein
VTHRHRTDHHRRRPLVARGVALLAALALLSLGLTPNAAAQLPLSGRSVTISILSLSRSSPAATTATSTLTVVLQLTNTTDQSLSPVRVEATRGNPIASHGELDQAIGHPQAPDPNLAAPIVTDKPVTADLSARSSSRVSFTTTTSTDSSSHPGLCICANAIYPLVFSAHTTDLAGADIVVGTSQTFVPAFGGPNPLPPMQVSWIWPILEKPHRLLDEQVAGKPPVFVDDDLATQVAVGRLSRVLDVLTQVAGKLPMTVVIDPELIDELAVISAGDYSVDTGGGKTSPGVGTAAAKDWLDRLRIALSQPGIQVSYTPFADPDVESLTRNGLTWTQTLGPTAQQRVATALGDPPLTNVVWPLGETLSSDTLDAVIRQGASSVVLNDRSLPTAQQTPPANGLTTVQSSAGPISAVVTSSDIQRYVSSVVSLGSPGLAQLPELVAEVAMRGIESGDAGSYVAIVPPRTVNPDPQVAARAILDTAHASWSRGRTVSTAAATVAPSDRGPLLPPPLGRPGLSTTVLSAADRVSQDVPALNTMLQPTDAARLLGSLPAGLQRAESSEWQADPTGGGDAFAEKLTARLDTLESGVHIVQPSSGTYTLAASNSPLPVTIKNDLDVTVTVRVRVESQFGLPGFTAREVVRQSIAPNTSVLVKIPTHVERTGRFQVRAILLTPSNQPIGQPVTLSVHSTALGLIGVIITVAAGGVLALALVLRMIRRLRRRGDPGPPDPFARARTEPATA